MTTHRWIPCRSPLASRWTFRGEQNGYRFWSSPSGKLYAQRGEQWFRRVTPKPKKDCEP